MSLIESSTAEQMILDAATCLGSYEEGKMSGVSNSKIPVLREPGAPGRFTVRLSRSGKSCPLRVN